MEQYQIHDLSERQLKFGYWLLTHAPDFKKALIIGLIAVSAVLWVLAIYQLTVYLVFLPQDPLIIQGIVNNEINFEDFRQRNKPQDLIYSPVRMIYTGANKYDFAVEAYNPNQGRGAVALNYYFMAGDFSTAPAVVAILPQQKVFLLSLANETVKRLTDPQLRIAGLTWQPLGQRSAGPSIEPISVSQAKFTPATTKGGRSYVTFEARNNLFKNLWRLDFQAGLYSNDNLVGVNQISVAEFLAEQTREMEMSWFESLPQVSRVEIVPLVNIYDPGNFYVLPGAAQEE